MKSNLLSYTKSPIINYTIQMLQNDNTVKDVNLTKDNIYTATYIFEGKKVTNTGRLMCIFADGDECIHIVLDISEDKKYMVHDTCTVFDIAVAS